VARIMLDALSKLSLLLPYICDYSGDSLVNRSVKVSWLIIGVILIICGSVGLFLKIQEIRDRNNS